MSEQKKQHPLVEKILNTVTFDPMYANIGMPDPQVLFLSDKAKQLIKQEFEKYFDSKELLEAIMALLQLANAFDKEGHKEIGISVLEIVVTADEALEEQNKTKKHPVN